MKTLKLNHEAAIQVENGARTTTWRLYDDKDLAVNDMVRLIDKVDPHNQDTWRSLGVARIDSIIQKRLGASEDSDYQNPSERLSPDRLLALYREYYGPQVDLNTPVKVIRFTLHNEVTDPSYTNVFISTPITEFVLYADGGSRGNPGPSASGFVLLDSDNQIVVKKGVYLGITTNNQAEYQALKLGLEEAKKIGARSVRVYMDSLLVVNQMLGKFKVRNRDLWPIYTDIKTLLADFAKVSFTHVPRELNKIADAAVNETLDAVGKGNF